MSSTALDAAWQSQRRWSAVATALKSGIGRARRVALGLAIAGAVLVTLGAQATALDTTTGKVLGGAGAVALAIAPIVRFRWTGQASVRDWVRARSVSESLKSEVYSYLTHSGDYGKDGEDPDAHLARRRSELEDKVRDLARHAARARPSPKPVPPVVDVDSYVALRLEEQIDGYYLKNVAKLARRLAWLRGIEAAFILAAAALGALAVFLEADGMAAWVPVVTAVAAAITAHIAAERYEHDILGFYATAQRLANLRDSWRGGGVADASAFVLECENVISSENQEWMADWLAADAK